MPDYDLSPIPDPSGHGPTLPADTPCSGCGYNLRGLPLTGVCPECGRAVELTLRGHLLRYASPAYLRQVDLGLSIILTAIVISFIVFILNIAIAVLGHRFKIDTTLIVRGISLACSGLFILGYWKYTAPDPGFTGVEKAASARTIARIAACANAACEAGSFILGLVGLATIQGIQPSGTTGTVVAVGAIVAVVVFKLAAWATQFFAIVLYTRWLAERIPDHELISRSRTYIWLLPVLYTVGSLVCVGPLIALILYATMLHTLRLRTKAILDWQERGGSAAMV